MGSQMCTNTVHLNNMEQKLFWLKTSTDYLIQFWLSQDVCAIIKLLLVWRIISQLNENLKLFHLTCLFSSNRVRIHWPIAINLFNHCHESFDPWSLLVSSPSTYKTNHSIPNAFQRGALFSPWITYLRKAQSCQVSSEGAYYFSVIFKSFSG